MGTITIRTGLPGIDVYHPVGRQHLLQGRNELFLVAIVGNGEDRAGSAGKRVSGDCRHGDRPRTHPSTVGELGDQGNGVDRGATAPRHQARNHTLGVGRGGRGREE